MTPTRRVPGHGGGRADRRAAHASETGSVLLLSMIYLIAVSLTVAALAGWASNDLQNTTKFRSTRIMQEADRSAVELAMENIRYTPMLSTTQTTSNYCWGTGPFSQLTIDGSTIDTFCKTVWTPTSAQTRIVTISACTNTGQSVTVQATNCTLNPDLRVQVTFDDYPPAGSVPISGSCTLWSWCGEGQTINSWIWR
jgi:hypothetical protein